MKRKANTAASPSIVSKEILDGARKSMASDQLKRSSKCVVCGASCSPNSTESLCWVCRRLKISAWREVEQQMPAQD